MNERQFQTLSALANAFLANNQLIIEGYVMSYWKEMAESKLSPFY